MKKYEVILHSNCKVTMNCDQNSTVSENEDRSTTKAQLHGVCVCFGAGKQTFCTQKLHGETTSASENRAKKESSQKESFSLAVPSY